MLADIDPAHGAAVCEELMLERARRKPRARPDFRATLYPGQFAAFDCQEMNSAIIAGRRWGKSEVGVRILANGAYEQPGSSQVYLAQTHFNCEDITWPVLKALDEQMGLGIKFNEAKLRASFPNGSRIYFGSWNNEGVIKKYRGGKPNRVIVDECGELPPAIMRRLRQDILGPSLVDFRGRITWMGTPGRAWSGPWFEMTGPPDFRVGSVPVFTGTMFDNPYLPHAAEVAAMIREGEGWDEDHPTYVREYLGLWCRDDEALVFPFDPERNQADDIPDSDDVPQDGWWFVLGVDVGQVDATAYTVMGAHPNDPNDYLIESSKASGLLVDQVAADVRRYLKLYPRCAVVMDTGGMGKQHAEELRRRYGIPVIAAEKREKESAIRVMRDRLLAGRLKVLAGERNDAWRDEAAVCRWNEDRDDFEDDQEDHALHASLYAHRRLRHYRHELLEKRPPPGTGEAYRVEADEMKRAAIERVKKAKGSGRRPKWDE